MDKIKQNVTLHESKYLITLNEYFSEDFQICITSTIIEQLKMLKFIQQPFAWLLGQTFKYFLKPNENFENLINETYKRLKIDFDFPIVG